ncbi:pyridoxal phosphate-dependent transferase [Fusarium acuminatum]|uniref:Pyridoxal phosphate-dependent transferase n=1 Tax=Fusarium acuminatum TaxID=5515 RepID=A0ABZ2WGF9_9HYPO
MATSIRGGNSRLYRYNAAVEEFRETEYPMIKDSIYLDHAGSTLCSKSLMDSFAREMTTVLYGNPHSASPSSQQSTSRVEDARMNLLTFFGADPAEYDVVFVANATAGVKLIVDAMRTQPDGFLYAYHQACHTSLVGVREEAVASTSIDDDEVKSWLEGQCPFRNITTASPLATLFAYPAQSHMDGRRYPLTWTRDMQKVPQSPQHRVLTLLDASSFVATSRLDLGDPNVAPDFTVLSLYKIFGFPDLGAFHGAWISLAEFEKLASLKNIHIRTGGLCSPGGIASALDLQPWEMKKNFSAGFRCGADSDIMSGKPTGVIRASLGAMSTEADVDGFVTFIKEFYQERKIVAAYPDLVLSPTVKSQLPALRVKSVTVYPVKSCAGFSIPTGVPWEVRPEGLAWDREWCLVHHGSGHALSQKRCPKMALLRPVFPPGGLGLKSRLSKAQVQRYQQSTKVHTIPGSFPDVPSPPDSDSEQQKSAKILLSNESPILMIHSSSVDALNEEISSRGGRPVVEKSFRANIVLEQAAGSKSQPAFSEDSWDSMHIGRQNFKLMGACRRCQMVCIDQETGEKKEEPFVTLAKTRRFDGKVYFGVHMRHDPLIEEDVASRESQYPIIEVGDPVTAIARG